ncbi:hypothetical protein IQ266_02025 [filamentous cyanobacterium LEGE 11480]|uniref:Uncharacterized protein n=1 Tax=Romeriopsis navalis LEGE 11480 TaxID=2777977 RepID=A0A928Z1I3_9CYAN|nr:hypothetical protein [Romeriopsis navalis LEGE 11480]
MIETAQDVQAIEAVIPAAQAIVCQLWAKLETLDTRIRRREIGSGLDWHLARAIELAQSLPLSAPANLGIWTDEATPDEIAHKIIGQVNWVNPIN